MSEPGARRPPNEAVAKAARELVALVVSHLPQRFYPSERAWRIFSAATMLRMADTVEATMALMAAGLSIEGSS